MSAVGKNECIPNNPYKNTLYSMCLNSHGSVEFEISARLVSLAAFLVHFDPRYEKRCLTIYQKKRGQQLHVGCTFH